MDRHQIVRVLNTGICLAVVLSEQGCTDGQIAESRGPMGRARGRAFGYFSTLLFFLYTSLVVGGCPREE